MSLPVGCFGNFSDTRTSAPGFESRCEQYQCMCVMFIYHLILDKKKTITISDHIHHCVIASNAMGAAAFLTHLCHGHGSPSLSPSSQTRKRRWVNKRKKFWGVGTLWYIHIIDADLTFCLNTKFHLGHTRFCLILFWYFKFF